MKTMYFQVYMLAIYDRDIADFDMRFPFFQGVQDLYL